MKAKIRNVENIRICGGKNVVCHWPLQGGIWYFGDDEILLGHIHAPCRYENPQEVTHMADGMRSRAVVRLQRSRDLGRTWPEEESQILYDFTLPQEEQRSVLHLDEYTPDSEPEREHIDLSQPDAIMAFGFTHAEYIGKEYTDPKGNIFCPYIMWGFRSANRGHTWEKIPSIIWPNHTDSVHAVGNCYLKQEDGTLLAWLASTDHLLERGGRRRRIIDSQVYMSVDNGVRWYYVSEIYSDPHRRVSGAYSRIMKLPSGRLLCTLGMWMSRSPNDVRWISLNHSDDGGLSWSEPRRINRWGISPYPVLLKDGRIIIIYARRHPNAYGMFCMVSEDEGRTWSDEVILRKDTMPSMGVAVDNSAIRVRKVADGGYPVAVQLRDGKIFTAYYYQLDEKDVPWPGGRKFIAGTFFDLA